MNAPVDVLYDMREAAAILGANKQEPAALRLLDAHDALAELIEAGSRAEVAFNTVRYCYTRAPGNFAVAMSELDSDIAPFRAALARVGAK